MPRRKISFTNGHYYHIYNRGTEKRKIFLDKSDYDRFITGMIEFNTEKPIGSLFQNSFRELSTRGTKLVEIVAYCLNPNHYHFILRQNTENGVSNFMLRLTGGYARYFNEKYQRNGSLFQGPFQAVQIADDHYLKHLSVYVNLNNLAHQLPKKDLALTRTSWEQYSPDTYHAATINKEFVPVQNAFILSFFKDKEDYSQFALATLGDIKRKKAEKKIDKRYLEQD